MPQQQSSTKQRTRFKKPSMYKVIIFNDDETTMEFVVNLLVEIFNKQHAEAEEMMLRVHIEGQAVVGIYTYDIARTKVSQASNKAQDAGFPLRLTYKPE